MRSLHPPEPVLAIAQDLERAGFEVWCVGGAVRDALLGHLHLDWDFATNATPDQVRTVFGRRRTIPVGVEFGTVGVLDDRGVLHEITTFRRDVQTDGRHAVVEFGASLDEDLARRDFTINAIAYSPSREVVYDPFHGREDLERGVIRAVGEPDERMREDRLRALRAIRFAARFGFEIERATWEAIKRSAPLLERLSAERVKQELEKTMDQVRAPSKAIELWRASGALEALIPDLSHASAEVMRALDCAAMPTLKARPGRRLSRLTILFSDLAAERVGRVMGELRFSKQESQWSAAIVDRWRRLDTPISSSLRSGDATLPPSPPSAAQVRRWVAIIGRLHLGAFFRLASARWAARAEQRASGGAPAAQAVHKLYRRARRAALTEPVDLRDLAVDGDDLRQVGIAPGPRLGKILSSLLDIVIEEPAANTRDRLLAEASRLYAAAE